VNRKVKESCFVDDVFYGEKTSDMVEFSEARVEAALSMIRYEKARAGGALRVLDVGCGDGTFSKMIFDMGDDVYGINKRAERVEIARQKGVKASVADLGEQLPFDDQFFSLVYAAEVLEHVYDTEFFLHEAKRVLKRDGALIITVPNLACLPNRVRLVFGLYPRYVAPARKHWGVGEHVRAFTKGMLIELLARNGFEFEDLRANLVSLLPTRRTRRPWSKRVGRVFPAIGEVLICKARKSEA
jgi:SAM-dependent methyltransferase